MKKRPFMFWFMHTFLIILRFDYLIFFGLHAILMFIHKILKFERLEEIGRGTFSTVYKCKDPDTSEFYAMKIIDKIGLDSQSKIDQVSNEIYMLNRFSHPNIIKLHSHYEDEHSFYLIEDLCDGGDLFKFFQTNALSESTTKKIFRQIVSAVCYMHEMNYAHRDLKPENILFTSYFNLKICDFAFCDVGINEQKKAKKSVGTLSYCSPECILNKELDSRKSDIWSLGVILYLMTTGKLPWNRNNQSLMIRQIIKAKYNLPNCSNSLQSLIREMLKLDPNERITAKEILEHEWMN